MAYYNKVILMGEYVDGHREGKYLRFQLRTVESYRSAQGEDIGVEDLFRVEAYGKAADTIETFVAKGDPLLVDGRVRGNGLVILRRFQFIPRRK